MIRDIRHEQCTEVNRWWSGRAELLPRLARCPSRVVFLPVDESSPNLPLHSPSISRKAADQSSSDPYHPHNVSHCIALQQPGDRGRLGQLQSRSGQFDISPITRPSSTITNAFNTVSIDANFSGLYRTAPPRSLSTLSAAMPKPRPHQPRSPPFSSSAFVVCKKSLPLPRLVAFFLSGRAYTMNIWGLD